MVEGQLTWSMKHSTVRRETLPEHGERREPTAQRCALVFTCMQRHAQFAPEILLLLGRMGLKLRSVEERIPPS